MSKSQTITLVGVECDSPREYRAVRHLCASYPHKAQLVADGWILVHDAGWFCRLLASCNGRVVEERTEVAS